MDGRRGLAVRMRLVALCLLVAAPVPAQVVKRDGKSDLAKLAMVKPHLRVSQTLTPSDKLKVPLTYAPDIARFRQQHGQRWSFTIDERTGKPNLITGGSIPFIPGAGNKLEWKNFAPGCSSPSCIPRDKMETLGRSFLTGNTGALRINPAEFVLDASTVPAPNSSVYTLRYQWVKGGIPVEDASVFLTINNGNLIQIGMTNIGEFNTDTKPTVTADQAWAKVRAYAHMTDKDQVIEKGKLAIIPVTPQGVDPEAAPAQFGKALGYALVYKLGFRRPGVPGSWEAVVDAHSGEILRFLDVNAYGHVQGGVYKTDQPFTEVTEPFSKTDYVAGNFTDTAGDFPGVSGTCTMTGPTGGAGVSGGVTIHDTCGAISLAGNAIGIIDFGNQSAAGTDCTTPGVGGPGNTHAARTQDWNVTQIKMKGITYLPTNTWLQGTLNDNVNLNQVCNAYWSPLSHDLNFFKSGTLTAAVSGLPYDWGCANSGELPGVSLHEWGHGMDSNDGSGTGTDNRPIETRADWTALLQTHQSCTGNGFTTSRTPAPTYGNNCSGYGNACTACTGIRDADWAHHATATPWTPQNKGTVWGTTCGFGYTGPCGWEDHCESGIATQALWDFVNRDLVAAPTNLDLVSAWQLADRLFYAGMPQSKDMYTCTGTTTKTSNGCGAGSLYTVMRAIDDDGDGVGNGTPHAAAIFAALNRHGIACGAAGDAANQNQTSCPALTTPTLTVTANNNQATLNWTSGGASATRYFIYRNETSCSAGFSLITTVSAPTTSYVDTAVVHGATYFYRVEAATANNSCVSAMSSCGTATLQLPADQDYYVRDWTVNAGSHDQGQEPSTNYTVNWAYSSDVWNRGSNTPGTPSNDWYPTDNMFAGSGTTGDNYAFVRVSRNATGSAGTVTAQFMISPFGVGSNFSSIATATLNFAAGDSQQVQGAYWHQDDVASTHACIAVQIHTATDPYLDPDLSSGHSPGNPDGQTLIVLDNNKAQRNLSVSHNVPHFTGFAYATIHNPSVYVRDMVLSFDSPARDQFQGAQIEVMGEKPVSFKPGGMITLPAMQPGENRWIGIQYTLTKNEAAPLHFLELSSGHPVNAFTILAQPTPVEVLLQNNLREHAHVFGRLGAIAATPAARTAAENARKLLQARVAPAQYLAFLNENLKTTRPAFEPLLPKLAVVDTVGAVKTHTDLEAAVGKNQLELAAAHHAMLLNRLDALATMLQKSGGDPADALQMVMWQAHLFGTDAALAKLKVAPAVVAESNKFIAARNRGKPARNDYADLLRQLLPSFQQTAAERANLKPLVAAIQRNLTAGPAALEKAHREYLLKLSAK